MWTDARIIYDSKTDKWAQETSLGIIPIESHPNTQMLEYVEPYFNGVKGQFVFKANNPWRIITRPGWSVLQLPMFYNFNQEWSVLPGVIDTDVTHQINQQILYHGNNTVVQINRGDPLSVYIPFERKKIDHYVGYQTKDDEKKFKEIDLKFATKFIGSGVYRSLQRKRDKDVR
jgi:hypothetical protein